jgi:hypothetical protein
LLGNAPALLRRNILRDPCDLILDLDWRIQSQVGVEIVNIGSEFGKISIFLSKFGDQ